MRFIVIGMGGSHLAADLVKMALPELDIIVCSDYNLPAEALAKGGLPPLIIAFSHSGNTEETIAGFNEAIKNNWPVVAVSVNGQLLELAKKHVVRYVQLPDSGLPPRFATRDHLVALLQILEQKVDLPSNLTNQDERGRELAGKLKDKVPIIYSSTKNWALANNWKIRINETSKSPAFFNVFPELNHNEMGGFGKDDVDCFHFIFLKDNADHPRILKRMMITQKVLEDQGFGVSVLDLGGGTIWEKILNSINLADATTGALAQLYGVDPEQVPLVEEFKKMIG